MKRIRDDAIERFMTPDPICIDASQPIAEAHRKMLAIGCRHLPLLSGGKLVGLVSQRGLYRLEARDSLARATRSAYDAIEEPFVVVPGTPVTEVAAQMAASRLEVAIIVDHGHVVGIFTEADALRALTSVMFTPAKPAGRIS